jgi:PAS domain S-box-containing protein
MEALAAVLLVLLLSLVAGALVWQHRAARIQERRLEDLVAERTRQLQYAQDQFKLLFATSPLGIGFADANGNVLSANAAMAQMFGYPEEEFVKANVADFFPSPQERTQLAQRLLAEGTIQVSPVRLRRKDGSLFYASLTESRLEVGDREVLLGVVNDISDRMHAEEVQKEAAERAAVAEERSRIARELHDSVTQSLYTISLIAEALPKVLLSHPEEVTQSVTELRQLAYGALAEMRTLLLELRPGELLDRDLGELLRQLVVSTASRTDIPMTVTSEGDSPLPADVKVALYRIAQEALNNVGKHAHASRAQVHLMCHQDGTVLRIRDDGAGFEQEDAQAFQLGLGIMRERIHAIGGTLTLNSHPGEGTEIIARWDVASARGDRLDD